MKHLILKIAHRDSRFRRRLISKLAKGPSYKDYVENKKRKGEKPLSEEDWADYVLGKSKKDEVEEAAETLEKAGNEISSLKKKLKGAKGKDKKRIRNKLETTMMNLSSDLGKLKKSPQAKTPRGKTLMKNYRTVIDAANKAYVGSSS